MKLIFENIRCFDRRHEIPIKPYTILVGENSTGKTTFLALHRLAWDVAWNGGLQNFNEDPFELGTYDQIATSNKGHLSHAKTFTLGVQLDLPPTSPLRMSHSDETYSICTEFEQGEAQPTAKQSRLEFGQYLLAFSRHQGDALFTTLTIRTPRVPKMQVSNLLPRVKVNDGIALLPAHFLSLVLDVLRMSKKETKNGKGIGDLTSSERDLFEHLLSHVQSQPPQRPIALAPLRSRPERVYSTMQDERVPSGAHAPMVLMKMLSQEKGRPSKNIQKINGFGQSGGLFDKLSAKSLGRKKGDPLQILVGNHSPLFNLVDVGYGVSQVLPILIDSLTAQSGATLLLQQPEVHLHPRAQAELATFLGTLVKEQKKQFVIETHSDYIIDRLRMDIRDKKTVDCSDVLILFFEKNGVGANIHPITIDENGNVVGAPDTYRKFFMDEERRYFGG